MPDHASLSSAPLARRLDWRHRLDRVVEMMREMSAESDPEAMVRAYTRRARELVPNDRLLSISRRDLTWPRYKISRSTLWRDQPNPWTQRHRLPILDRGILGELLYGDRPVIIDDFHADPDDPAYEHLAGLRSLSATPVYDRGVAMNMVVLLRKEPNAFDHEQFPELVWQANLFGRATHNLVLSDALRRAYDRIDDELKIVSEIQRSLLPSELPAVPGLDLAADYQTSRRAGGDYYDFFALHDGQWGILIADVSGHGTPAAVVMAITHAIAHGYPGPPSPPGELLAYLNRKLCQRYTHQSTAFVTAFYGIYDPCTLTLTYACAGHNPPRVVRERRCQVLGLNEVQCLPLGIMPDEDYRMHRVQLESGDRVVLYTDGITDARNRDGDFFGAERLDCIVAGAEGDAAATVRALTRAVDDFLGGEPAQDDRTVLVARVTG